MRRVATVVGVEMEVTSAWGMRAELTMALGLAFRVGTLT